MKNSNRTFNKTQKMLLELCLHGKGALTIENQKDLSLVHLHKIEKNFQRSQIAINRLKQERVNMWTNSFMKHFFPKAPVTQVFTEKYGDTVDLSHTCGMSFKDLNISRHDIAQKLIESKILPENFYSINDDFQKFL